MDYLTYTQRLDYLLELIKKGRLRSPIEIAERFECCEKTIRRMINCLREKGFDIRFCRIEKKYIIV